MGARSLATHLTPDERRSEVLRVFEQAVTDLAAEHKLRPYFTPGIEVVRHLRSAGDLWAYPTRVGKLKGGPQFWRIPLLVAQVGISENPGVYLKIRGNKFNEQDLQDTFAPVVRKLIDGGRVDTRIKIDYLEPIGYVAGRTIGKYP